MSSAAGAMATPKGVTHLPTPSSLVNCQGSHQPYPPSRRIQIYKKQARESSSDHQDTCHLPTPSSLVTRQGLHPPTPLAAGSSVASASSVETPGTHVHAHAIVTCQLSGIASPHARARSFFRVSNDADKWGLSYAHPRHQDHRPLDGSDPTPESTEYRKFGSNGLRLCLRSPLTGRARRARPRRPPTAGSSPTTNGPATQHATGETPPSQKPPTRHEQSQGRGSSAGLINTDHTTTPRRRRVVTERVPNHRPNRHDHQISAIIHGLTPKSRQKGRNQRWCVEVSRRAQDVSFHERYLATPTTNRPDTAQPATSTYLQIQGLT
jgi:hypothetical protein